MGRCEGYYRLENRRCDRDGERWDEASNGELYLLCSYHRREAVRTTVARWSGETGLRRSDPTSVRTEPAKRTLAWG